MEICFRIADRQILSILDRVICPGYISIFISGITLVKINGFSPNLVCALILWTSAFGLLIAGFHLFLTELSASNTSIFYFQDNTFSKSPWILLNLMCALILWRSALGLLIGKFCQFLTELSSHDTITAGYYRFTFY